jgi:uncharacterized protein YoxC
VGSEKLWNLPSKNLISPTKRLQATIQSTSVKIDDTEKNIETLTLSIGELENRIDRNKYLISNYIQAINEIEHSPVAFSILKKRSLVRWFVL